MRAIEASKLARDNSQAELQQALLALERAELDEQAADTSIARAALVLEAARLALSFGEITAPIDGVVAQRTCRVGQSFAAQQAGGTFAKRT